MPPFLAPAAGFAHGARVWDQAPARSLLARERRDKRMTNGYDLHHGNRCSVRLAADLRLPVVVSYQRIHHWAVTKQYVVAIHGRHS